MQKCQYDHFQVMRGVACLMVFVSHTAGLLSVPITDTWYAYLIPTAGFPWVWLFLILSGFLLTKQFVDGHSTLDADGVLAFYRRRFWRLMPMMWFAAALFGLLYYCGIWPDRYTTFQPFNELSIALALPWVPYLSSGNPVSSVNSPVWSAVLEVHYFILLPMVLILAKMSPRIIIGMVVAWIVGMILLAYAVIARSQPIFSMIYQQHLYNGGFLLAGCALALTKPKKINMTIAALSVFAGVAISQLVCTYNVDIALALTPFILLPAMTAMVAAAGSNYQAPLPSGISDLGLMRPLRWIELAGMMSYSIYILHKPLAYIAESYLHLAGFVQGIPSLALMTLIIAVVISAPIITAFIFIEIRFRRAGRTKGFVIPPESKSAPS